MRYFNQKAFNFFNRTTTRRASVLILVVVLVVLLALMGTALLSTTQGDRYIAAKHTSNTQIDLLVDGVVQITKATIVDDLYGDVASVRTFRPPWDSSAAPVAPGPGVNAYENWDMPYNGSASPPPAENDIWLAPRTPMVSPFGATATKMAWASITSLPGFSTFDSPVAVNANTGEPSISLPTTYTDRSNAPPRFLSPAYANIDGMRPAWVFPAGAGSPVPRSVLAADADGDGIADSGFFKLPVGELEGLTYYAAVRIVDNNSAVNVNTAYSRASDYEFTAGTFSDTFGNILDVASLSVFNDLGAFPSHVGLYELVNSPAVDMTAIAKYRTSATVLNKIPVGDPDTAHGGMAWASPDFEFTTNGDLMYNQVANRLDNPGYLTIGAPTTATRVKTFMHSDASALARHMLLPTLSSPSELELKVKTESDTAGPLDSIFKLAPNNSYAGNTSAVKGKNAYPVQKAGDWYNDNYNFDGVTGNITVQGGIAYNWLATPATYKRPIRSILTTYNPTSTQVPARAVSDPLMTPYRTNSGPLPHGSPTKTNINTAEFGELYRAFWSVIVEDVAGIGTPFKTMTDVPTITDDIYKGMKFDAGVGKYPFKPLITDFNAQRMFRSSIRIPQGGILQYFAPKEQVKLRAAAAAVQTVQWRDPAATQVIKQVSLNTNVGPVTANIFGASANDPQPFISEVFAWYDPSYSPTGPGGQTDLGDYVAIELFNPYYGKPVTLTSNYKIYAIDRQSGTYILPLTSLPPPIFTFSGQQIQAGGYMVIDNYGSTDVPFIPPSANFTGTVSAGTVYIHAPLQGALNKELIIVNDHGGGGANFAQMQPIDSFDFSGFSEHNPDPLIAATATQGMAWHYARATQGNLNAKRWQCVYPGRYDARRGNTSDPEDPRQQGTDPVTWTIPGGTDPWISGKPGVPVRLGLPNDDSTFPTVFSIPLADTNWPGPNPVSTAGPKKFPYGGFARDGDILEIPFIASYTITDPSGQLIEMNSISMDASFAEDTDPRDDFPVYPSTQTPPSIDPPLPREQVGRFAPLPRMLDATGTVVADDFDYDPLTPDSSGNPHPYAWARDLFDYLTVRTPATDYFPNISPTIFGAAKPVDNDGINGAGEETPSPNAGKEDSLGIQGLININTASWKVLSAIPWMPYTGTTSNDKFKIDPATLDLVPGSNNVDDNEEIAKLIVYWRDGDPLAPVDGKGPFKSIFDLYRVTNPAAGTHPYLFQTIQKELGTTAAPGRGEGYFSPLNPGDPPHEVRNDFQEQYRMMTKVSNLLTTRSDTFTVYVLVQGWSNVGTDSPKMVVQRRVAFIQDRSSVTASNSALPASVNVPND